MINREMEHELRAFIAVAEACWRKREPSYSWHVLDWMSYKMRRKYPLVRASECVVRFDATVT